MSVSRKRRRVSGSTGMGAAKAVEERVRRALVVVDELLERRLRDTRLPSSSHWQQHHGGTAAVISVSFVNTMAASQRPCMSRRKHTAGLRVTSNSSGCSGSALKKVCLMPAGMVITSPTSAVPVSFSQKYPILPLSTVNDSSCAHARTHRSEVVRVDHSTGGGFLLHTTTHDVRGLQAVAWEATLEPRLATKPLQGSRWVRPKGQGGVTRSAAHTWFRCKCLGGPHGLPG